MTRRTIWRYLGIGFGTVALASFVVLGIYVYSVSRDLPSVDTLKNYNPPVTTRVYAGNGTVIGEYARERRIFVPIQFVPKRVIDAFISAEDKNFYTHPGIDVGGIIRAGIKDVYNVMVHKRLQGASTITQQVAKNFLLNSQVKFSRKIREAILAIRIDATYPKDKILELYLNEIYLGLGAYGIAAASLVYFDKGVNELTIPEAAYLAALPKAPPVAATPLLPHLSVAPPPTSVSAQTPLAPTSTTDRPPGEISITEPAGAGNLTLTLDFSEDCWTEIFADGHRALAGVVHAGQVRQLRAHDSFRVTLGNAGGVRLSLNGRSLRPLGTEGEAVHEIKIDRTGLREGDRAPGNP